MHDTDRFSVTALRTAAIFLFIVSALLSARAVTFTVTKTADTFDGACDADCSLREAILAANAVSTDDVIEFSPAVFNTAKTVATVFGEFTVANNGSLTINGTGANLLTLDGSSTRRVFDINSGAVAFINAVKITRGNGRGSTNVIYGGAIYNRGGNLTISNSNISDNGTVGSGVGRGGAIYNTGTLTLNTTILNGNHSANGTGDDGEGGAIYNQAGSTFNLNNSIISDNSAGTRTAGGIYDEANVTVNIIGSTISGNICSDAGGGGIYHTSGALTITGSTISNNTATNTFARGGGIHFLGGTLTVSDTTFGGNAGPSGGGIYLAAGTGTISNSTFRGNSATNGNGGGMANGGSVTITNTTFTGNTVATTTNFDGGFGGGINNGGGTLNITNSTFNQNNASGSAGGLRNNAGTVTARNTIFGDNTTTFGTGSLDYGGILNSQGYNLIENTTGTIINGTTTGNVLGQDPQLAALRNNGGVTETVALHASSPAIDAGDPNNFPANDQRGIERPQDGDLSGTALPDIGAYERQPIAFTVTKTADTFDGACDADCSLREAFAAAAAHPNTDVGILFDSTFNAPQAIVLTRGEILTGNSSKIIALYGTGANLLTISGNSQSRIFYSPSSSLLLSGVRLTSGNGGGANNSGFGGAVYNGVGFLAIVNSTVTYNSAQFSGGAIFSGQNNSGGVLRVVNSTVSNNNVVNGVGGGIILSGKSGDIINSVISENSPHGIYADGTTLVLTISNSKINNNMSGLHLYTFSGSVISDSEISGNRNGGGIYNSGKLSILRSTISGNSTLLVGGAIENDFSGNVTLTNVTVSGNFAEVHGGAIFNRMDGSITLNNSTVVFNKTNGVGGGVFNNSAGTINARNTIIARNQATVQSPDFEKGLVSQGYNLIGNTTGMTITGTTIGNLLNIDPRLDPVLRYNGGATQTHALRVGSPVLDKGAALAGVLTDQRGLVRPFDFPSVPNAGGGNGSDIGAFERQTNDAIRNFVPFDFDGDGKTDISIFRPSVGEWWINQSSTTQTVAAQFGSSTDKSVPADFSGDGKTDIAFWRPSSGDWFILRSEDSSFYSVPFGTSGDVPVVGDFDADGNADPSVFRPSNSTWYISKSSGGTSITTFGTMGDRPVPADYDGDGKTDIAIFRPSDGSWWYLRSSDNSFRVFSFGVSTDKPVPGDYTGDGRADIAVFRPSTGEWFFQRSEDNSYYSVPFGAAGDIPTPGDYDGDGKFDTAVFRPSDATWYVQRSTAGLLIQQFGLSTDSPVPASFVP